ncbi:glycoside hydrolase [Armillaria gallica]|uniref:Glycoside hydrolase n=1 Tax=Armillaria gallica TaxID=47427 RepID=A0A2H3DQB5_ARMGA|nr:glycoside hydrolase [Armillaria gallica]
MLTKVLLLSFAFPNRWSGISVALAQSARGTSSSVVSSTTSTPSSTSIPTTTSFPSIGSLPRDYTPEGLEQLWDIVGPVEPPPFTTTRVPSAAVTLPPSPPPLYPSFYVPATKDILPDLKFPKGFKYGVATAAYQVEGATKNEGKGPTMWDLASRQPNGVFDNSTGDIVDLHYFLYKEDVERSPALGVTAHSFSISWARIYPFSAADSPINTAGIDRYSDVIDYHLAHGVEPVVTLFHWDTPLALQAYYGAFTSPEIVNDFVKGTPWRSNSTEDILAVERHAAFQLGLFANPIYTTGDWPDIVKQRSPPNTSRASPTRKRAPDEGIDACIANPSHPLWPVCNEPVYFDSDYGWPEGPAGDPAATSLQTTPVAIRALLKEIYTRWPSDKMYISEFGCIEPFAYANADISQIKEDVGRTDYLLTYLGEMLLSIHEDGVPIQGAFAWAMIDDAEWQGGTSVRFGIQHVDYTTLERTYKRSALSLAEFFGSHLQD